MGVPFTLRKDVIERYVKNGLILDTGPLTLFLAGVYDYNSVGKNKLTKIFVKEDFDIVNLFVKASNGKIVVTPQILSEVSSFIKRDFIGFENFFEKVKSNLIKASEIYITKDNILSKNDFKRFGITDIGIILSRKKINGLILTTDKDLAREFSHKGIPIINLNHLRGIRYSQNQSFLQNNTTK